MRCFKCGNDIENNIQCPFCGYTNKEESKKQNTINVKKKNSNNSDYKEKYENKKIVNVICNILCYLQVAFSIMMAFVCLTLNKPFFPFVCWIIVAIIFISEIKSLLIEKIPKIRKWIIPIRIILIILAMIIFICNLPKIYEDEWISNDGISVKLKGNVAYVVENGVEYDGSYTTKYVDDITNITVTTENKNFKFYFKYNNDVIEFYYMKDNEKVYLVPNVKQSNYTYVESEKINKNT